MMNQGNLYIISAPSGAGKTSLVKKLLQKVDNLTVSISHTTRAKRANEIDRKNYHFISIPQFKEKIASDEFLEYAQVFDNFYGTSQKNINQQLNLGMDVILEIDWQGAQQVKLQRPEAKSIFILPPSIQTLQHRLQGRGQDSKTIIQRRMQDAVTDISHYDEFDYLVINDDFTTALQELKTIVIANRLLRSYQQNKLVDLIKNLLN